MRRYEIQKKFDEIVDFAGVEAYIDTPVKRYSSGMYVRLAFAVAAFLEPEILVVDEVLAVGDAEFQKKCLGRMKDVSVNEGRTVLFVSHNMAAIQALCETAILIEDGRIVCHDEAAIAVETYQGSAFAKLSAGQSVVISDEYRKLKTSREIELLEAELLPNGSNIFATRDPLNLRIKVRANLAQKSFRFAGSIFNKEGAKLATFFSNPVGLMSASDEKTFYLSLPHHNLGKGDYYLALSVGIGGNGKANVEFDIAHGILGFAITHDSSDGEPIIHWPKAWGAFSLHAQILEKK
jgi:lipopolysaccharide transport system ATP-binding protein